jgi:hypothetical protein
VVFAASLNQQLALLQWRQRFDSHPGHHFFTTIKNRVHLKKSHLFTKITLASGLQFKLHLILRGTCMERAALGAELRI